MLETNNLTYRYSDKVGFQFPDLSVDSSHPLLILGQSGVGKSTLLHLLAGLMQPTQGSIVIDGTDIFSLSNNQRDQFRGRSIGMIFQKNHFIESLSVIENITIAQYLAGQSTDKAAAQELLDRLNIGDKSNARITALSQGEKQRVAIARALINSPAIILADEPTSALDDINCGIVIDMLVSQASLSKAALIIVTHDARLKEHISKCVILEKSQIALS